MGDPKKNNKLIKNLKKTRKYFEQKFPDLQYDMVSMATITHSPPLAEKLNETYTYSFIHIQSDTHIA